MTIKLFMPKPRAYPHLPTAPGPRGHLLLGNIPAFRRDVLAATVAGHQQFGDLVRYRLGPIQLFVVSHPDLAEEVFVHQKQVFGKIVKNPLRLVVGDGLLTNPDNESWFRNRRMMQPMFHRQRIAHMGEQMLKAGEQMVQRWQATVGPNQPVNIFDEMMNLTFDIVGKTMFSIDILRRMEGFDLDKSVAIAINYAAQRIQNPFSLPAHWPTPSNLRFQRTIRAFDTLMYGLIDERRRERASTGATYDDLLDMLLDARDEETGVGMTDVELRDEVITIFAAGHETTAVALTWTWCLLSQYPAILRKLQAEVDGVLQGRRPTVADLPNLPYTLQVFEEAMRLYPPTPLLPRLATETTSLAGYQIPVQAQVLVSAYNIQRRPEIWLNPGQFDPERFTPENKKGRHRLAYLPFSAGPHLCIGNHFALMEAQLMLALITQHYELRLAPGHAAEHYVAITLRPKHGMPMLLHRRV